MNPDLRAAMRGDRALTRAVPFELRPLEVQRLLALLRADPRSDSSLRERARIAARQGRRLKMTNPGDIRATVRAFLRAL